MPTLDSFEANANALASVLWPRDPNVPSDKQAGDLVHPTTGDTFARQAFRLMRYIDKSPIYALTAVATLDESIDVFTELNARANALSPGDEYKDLPKGGVVGGALWTIGAPAIGAVIDAIILTVPIYGRPGGIPPFPGAITFDTTGTVAAITAAIIATVNLPFLPWALWLTASAGPGATDVTFTLKDQGPDLNFYPAAPLVAPPGSIIPVPGFFAGGAWTPGTQESVLWGTNGIGGYFGNALTPINTNYTAAEFGLVLRWTTRAMEAMYATNWPHSSYRSNLMKWAADDNTNPTTSDNITFVGPLSDASELINCPRIPLSGSGLDYMTYWYPWVKSIEDQAAIAFLEVVNNPVGAENALGANGAAGGLITEEAAKTLFLRTS